MDTVLFALWFFLPAGIANAVPVLASKAPFLSRWDTPIDAGRSYGGRRLLGDHKTWRGLVVGIFAAIAVVYVQQLLFQDNNWGFLQADTADYLSYSPVLLGFLFGFGALAGDAVESLIKRRVGIKSGMAWFPLDQIDYIIGGCLAAAFVIVLPLTTYIAILLLWFGLHLLFSYVGFVLRLKATAI